MAHTRLGLVAVEVAECPSMVRLGIAAHESEAIKALHKHWAATWGTPRILSVVECLFPEELWLPLDLMKQKSSTAE